VTKPCLKRSAIVRRSTTLFRRRPSAGSRPYVPTSPDSMHTAVTRSPIQTRRFTSKQVRNIPATTEIENDTNRAHLVASLKCPASRNPTASAPSTTGRRLDHGVVSSQETRHDGRLRMAPSTPTLLETRSKRNVTDTETSSKVAGWMRKKTKAAKPLKKTVAFAKIDDLFEHNASTIIVRPAKKHEVKLNSTPNAKPKPITKPGPKPKSTLKAKAKSKLAAGEVEIITGSQPVRWSIVGYENLERGTTRSGMKFRK
jgi:hypothetical protein